MSTHHTPCVMCGKTCSCCDDEHALGCGDGGCYTPGVKIEFCSIDCFFKLRREMEERLLAYCSCWPDKVEPALFKLYRLNGMNVDYYFKEEAKKKEKKAQ